MGRVRLRLPGTAAVVLATAAVPVAVAVAVASAQPHTARHSTAAAPVARPTPPAAVAPSPRPLRRVVLGYSVQHRPIVAYELGDPHARTTAVLIGQMHGDEPAGVAIARALLTGAPVRGIRLWVVPSINPDGSARGTRQNAHHVDLNRNWPVGWARLTGSYDSGPRPLSEPETRAVHRFLSRMRPSLLVSLHQPLDGVDTTDGGARDPACRHRLARLLHLPEKPLRCWSVCQGTMTRWLTATQRGAAITVEFPAARMSPAAARAAARSIVIALGGRL